MKRNVKEHGPKNAALHEKKVAAMNKKAAELQKRYPKNKYTVADGGKVACIVREGRRPHKSKYGNKQKTDRSGKQS